MKAIDRPFTNIINGHFPIRHPCLSAGLHVAGETQCAQLWRAINEKRTVGHDNDRQGSSAEALYPWNISAMWQISRTKFNLLSRSVVTAGRSGRSLSYFWAGAPAVTPSGAFFDLPPRFSRAVWSDTPAKA
jgi:hypothetical protein